MYTEDDKTHCILLGVFRLGYDTLFIRNCILVAALFENVAFFRVPNLTIAIWSSQWFSYPILLNDYETVPG
jgi:hypothetical protein